MAIIKKIWRDNTMPKTNYIWMKTNLKDELIGIYEWYNGEWRPIHPGGSDTYTREEIDMLLSLTEQEIAEKLANGEYEIGNIDELDSSIASEGVPSGSRVIATEVSTPNDSAYVLSGVTIEDGLISSGTAVHIEPIPESDVREILGLENE